MTNETLTGLLEAKRFSEANTFFTRHDYLPQLAGNVGDIVPLIVKAMRDNNTSPEDFEKLMQWLSILTSCTVPKEMLLFLLEQFEQHSTVHLLFHIKNVLLRMPAKRGSSLEWVLNTLSTSIANLPLPTNYDLEGEERKLLDFDPEVKTLTNVLPYYIDFLEPFVLEVSLNNQEKPFLVERIHHQRNVLQEFILNIFGRPLAFLDLHNERGDAKSNSRVIAEKLLAFISQLEGNPLELYRHSANILLAYEELPLKDTSINQIGKGLSEENLSSLLAIANIAYLLLVENTRVTINSVYTVEYLLRENLKHVIVLLIRSENVIVHKGMLMMNCLTTKISNSNLTKEVLELPENFVLIRCLFNIMIHCQLKELREMGLSIFKLYVTKFQPDAKAQLLCSLIQMINYSGAKGLIIQIFKDEVDKELKLQNTNKIFLGKNLLNFISYAIILPNDIETDLLEQSDSILSTLNLLRYIYQSDKRTVNQTGAWKIIKNVQKKMLIPLRSGLDLSKAHYELEKKNVVQSLKSRNEPSSSVSVFGMALPNLTKKQQIEMYNSALTFFDMIESVLVRLEEIIGQQYDP